MIAAIARPDVDEAFLWLLLVAVVGAIDVEASRVEVSEACRQAQAPGGVLQDPGDAAPADPAPEAGSPVFLGTDRLYHVVTDSVGVERVRVSRVERSG